MGVVNFTIVFRVVSRILFIMTVAMLLCIQLAVFYSEDILPFLFSSMISLGSGTVLFFLTGRRREKELIP